MNACADFLKRRTPKRYFAGTHRAAEPVETWNRIAPLLPDFGITRVADITGLDRIGIPVATAIRPLSRSISVAAGRGIDLVAAKVSAAMEAIECAHAEAVDRPLIFASRSELARTRTVVELAELPCLEGPELNEHTRLTWIEGHRLADGESIMLPYELVHAHYCPPGLPGVGTFLATTNGLSSGNALAEAVSHGLFEVIERDALNLWSRLPPPERDKCLIDLPLDNGLPASAFAARLEEAGFDIAVWDITSDLGVPAFHCVIIDTREPDGHPGTGTGCHADKDVALTRALLEAVQVRAIYISGGRDDLVRHEYEADHIRSFRSLLHSRRPLDGAGKRFAEVASHTTEYFEEDLALVSGRLSSGGYSATIVDLSVHPEIAVTRVVVPGLEGPLADNALPGRRALRYS